MYKEILPVMVIVFMFAIAYYASPTVEAGGYFGIAGKGGVVPNSFAAYLLPLLALVFYLVFLIIPKIEVYRRNMEHFSSHFWGFRVVFLFAMGAIFVATIIPSFGYWKNFDPMPIIIFAVALMFFYVGYMLNLTKRNYFIGFSTPWAIADERVWEKTNRLGGKLFWICGILTFVALIAPSDVRLLIVVLPLVIGTIAVSVYSLLEYRKLRGRLLLRPKGRRKAAKRSKKRK